MTRGDDAHMRGKKWRSSRANVCPLTHIAAEPRVCSRSVANLVVKNVPTTFIFLFASYRISSPIISGISSRNACCTVALRGIDTGREGLRMEVCT